MKWTESLNTSKIHQSSFMCQKATAQPGALWNLSLKALLVHLRVYKHFFLHRLIDSFSTQLFSYLPSQVYLTRIFWWPSYYLYLCVKKKNYYILKFLKVWRQSPIKSKKLGFITPQVGITASVQFSRSVVSNSLWPHEPQHTRPPCSSPTPGVHPNPCPLSWWCHPTISSSVVPFSSCPQSFPAPGSFQVSQPFTSGGQSIGVSASTSVLPMNTQDWPPLGWTGWISLQSKDSQESTPTPPFKSINSSALSFLNSPTLTSIHDHWKNHSLD